MRLGGDLAYTTAVTLLTRLLAKAAVSRARGGRSFAGTPTADAVRPAALRMRPPRRRPDPCRAGSPPFRRPRPPPGTGRRCGRRPAPPCGAPPPGRWSRRRRRPAPRSR
ncbi:BlaI/MecI/CopY family transcriptional regulator [Streptomyces tropicalis]|uniref:BlaI/MecI/CopY family transcriptional regulator n=1 Tax=Streptomyces tropicalis TaxID=3034234 RepID=UPI003F68B4AE